MKIPTLNVLPIDLWSLLAYFTHSKHPYVVTYLTEDIFKLVKSYESSLENCAKSKLKTYKF